MSFKDRSEAGRKLAKALAAYKDQHPVILALPRGGVRVAAEVAAALHAPLDLILVRKIGVPFQPELGMGAVVDGGAPLIVRNEDVIQVAGIDEAELSSSAISASILPSGNHLSSSPWVRGAPHSGFSTLIRRIKARSSASICGRPPNECDFQRQYRRKPARCQRTSVSGRMTVMTFSTAGNHRYSWVKNMRSPVVSRTRLCTIRRNIITWRRSAAFSASSRLFDLNGDIKTLKTKYSSAIIVRRR